ncbi:hypothetical protein F886_00049 [Acinetobacter sp. NIPH 542]|uniref:hypothetical protein n=1 Tax=Acinetobacter sp. NIPH 542 TaxID=1217688 RepID=UPI0002D12790|nr:hypothetical protein [Acinetobacter sp. NIPH 542]ENX48248.1 hypothetical protein F886_00049 [Acinetobacter sp. NIPH 542]
MKSKTLKEKISDIVFSICAGGVIYLIVGYLMKTNWLSCPKPLPDLYEIVRDTLTLMAYFLAPAIALALFTDWRQEHVEKSREQQGEELYKLVKQADSELHKLYMEASDEDNHNETQAEYIISLYRAVLDTIYKVEMLLGEFDFNDEQAIAFKNQVKDISDLQRESVSYVNLMYSAKLKAINPEQYNFQYEDLGNEEFSEKEEEKYLEFYSQYEGVYRIKHKLLKSLKPLKDSIKIHA